MRGNSGGGDAMLARAGFRDDARLFHLNGKKALADGVVDFVRAGVEKIFALEVDARAAKMRGEAFGELERCGAAGEILEEIVEAGLESRIGFGLFVDALEFKEGHHEGFRDVAAAVGAEASRNGGGNGELGGHGRIIVA